MSRCALCPGVNRCVAPHGSRHDYLLIGEAPGRDEDRQQIPFVGKTGEEVNRHYLPLAGLRRDQVTMTNAIKCWPTTAGGKLDFKQPKDRALLESCAAHHLYEEIDRQPPKLLVPMGVFACAAINPDIDLDLDHGLPCESPWGIPVFPMYHPAGGMHEPKKMLTIRSDWIRLRQYLAGTLARPVDVCPTPDYTHITAPSALDLDPDLPLACDTEFSHRLGPYCLTYSQRPGTGHLILADRPDLLEEFQRSLDDWRAPILFHSWLSDRPIVERMGLRFPEARIIDTLAWAFHLGNVPLGLKALARRELGIVMEDFDDVVTPHSTALVLGYLSDVYTHPYPWEVPPASLVRTPEGQWKLHKPQGLRTKLKRFFSEVRKHPDKDVFQAWANWERDHEEIEAVCGAFPHKDIRHVPFEMMLRYACRDADALLRLYPKLRRMRQRVRKFPQDQWRG